MLYVQNELLDIDVFRSYEHLFNVLNQKRNLKKKYATFLKNTGCFSFRCIVTSGVLHVNVPAPLLFFAYVNDIWIGVVYLLTTE